MRARAGTGRWPRGREVRTWRTFSCGVRGQHRSHRPDAAPQAWSAAAVSGYDAAADRQVRVRAPRASVRRSQEGTRPCGSAAPARPRRTRWPRGGIVERAIHTGPGSPTESVRRPPSAPGRRRSGASPSVTFRLRPAPGPCGPRPRPRTGGLRRRTARATARSRTRRPGLVFTYSKIVAPPPAIRTSRDAGGLAGLVERGLDAVVDEVEGGPAPPLPGITFRVGHDEDRCVERRLLRPRLLAGVEQALAHHARPGAIERLPQDVVVAPLVTASTELQVLPEEPLRENPLLQLPPLAAPSAPRGTRVRCSRPATSTR